MTVPYSWDELVADADMHMRSGKHPRDWDPPELVVKAAKECGLTAESLRDHILAAAFQKRLDEISRRQMPPWPMPPS